MTTRDLVLKAIEYIRANDCDFLTAESVGMYAGVSTDEAREVMLAEGYDKGMTG